MYRADRRRRLLLLNQLRAASSGVGVTAEVDSAEADRVDMHPIDDDDAIPEAADRVLEAAFDEFAVNSHILAPDPAEKFLAACRTAAPVPRLRIHAGGDLPPAEFSFRRPYALVGRSDRCDLRFDHPDISYRHAYLQVVAGRLHCFDLASRTGTRGANGERAGGVLDPRERILVGPVAIENIDPADTGAADTSVLLADDRPAALPPVFLEWPSRNGRPPRTARLERQINLLGWSKACHVRFERDAVSRVHASLVLTSDGVWLVDLLGRGGTLLDGQCIKFARLKDGAELQIGTCGFRLRLGEPPAIHRSRRRRRRRERRADVVINQNFLLPGAAGAPAAGALPRGFAAASDGRNSGSRPTHGSENRATSTHGSESRAPVEGGISEGFVLSLFGQFAEMHRAMFSQTQQQLALLTQMLASLHQSQQDLIREDVRRVNEINRELQLLQMQLFQQSAGRSQYRLTAAGSSPAESSGSNALLTGGAGTSGPPGASDPGIPAGADEIVDVAFDFDAAAPQSPNGPLSSDDDSDVVPLDEDDQAQQPTPGSSRPAATSRTPRRGAEHHEWLTQRMHGLERERNSRWQKIMSLLTGGRS
jgi:pSer/pThr/pTyr-binding forkhead associated (FHA) protein